MKVLFLSFSRTPEQFRQDPSFRYRCENLCLALCERGIKAEIAHFELAKNIESMTHVIFHRPVFSIKLRRILRKLEKLNITTIADFDDLVFDLDFLIFSPALLNSIQPRKSTYKKYSSHQKALELFSNVSVSTQPLAKHVLSLLPGTKVRVIQNSYFIRWSRNQNRQAQTRNKVITYFPGTRSHDRDFWQVEESIDHLLRTHENLSLLVIGPVKSKLLAKKRQNIKHLAKLPFREYSSVVDNSWVNLLPLEPTPFNQCKSALKVLEAGFYGKPTLCSALPDAVRLSQCGALFALDSDQWISTLEKLMTKEYYEDIVSNIESSFYNTTSPDMMALEFISAFSNHQVNK